MSNENENQPELLSLLEISKNPLLKDYTEQQLVELVRKLRTIAISAPTMSSIMANDSEKIRPKNALAAKRKELLDTL